MARTLDFDSNDAVQVVKDAYSIAEEFQRPRITVHKREHKIYNAIIDMAQRDPDRANIFIPKLWSIIKTKVPRDLRSLGGNRPYFPIDTKRKDFKEFGRVWEDYIDDLVEKANWWVKLDLAALIKTTYGTAFIDAIPWWEQVKQSQAVIGPNGQPMFVSQMVPRMRLRFKVWGPWEVFIDPAATNLEEAGGCRYVIKIQLASKREIIKLAQQGGYPMLDIDQLMDPKVSQMSPEAKHKGVEMMESLGVASAMWDGDIGVLFRYETPERYIDVWNGEVLLRDIPNPFRGQDGSGHGRINLARWVHEFDAHTQNQMWGIGEVKPGEILQEYLNDLNNMVADSHSLMNQPVIYYDKNALSANQLVRTMGNRVEVDRGSNPMAPIDHYVKESFGQPLPPDHYRLIEKTAMDMDLTAGQYDVGRGEPSQGDPTATEIAYRKEGEGSRQEANIKRGEKIFLNSIGALVVGCVDQFALPDDIVEVVGAERAQMAMFGTLSDVPGGYNFSFKGSDKVARELIEQRNWKELAPVLNGIGNVSPEFLARKLLEVYDVPETEIDQAVIPDQVMMLVQAMREQQEFQQNMQIKQGPTGRQPGGRYKQNNTKQVGRQMAQERIRQ